ncbi:MAG: glycerol-3-phosphate 1-O-acyltransferase PlsY [Verrucomicrobiota bacterium]
MANFDLTAFLSLAQGGSLSSWPMIAGIWVICFLIGGIPFGFVAGKLNGMDIRTKGSGNIGATNVFRTLGKGWGITVFVFDFLKAYMPLMVIQWLFDPSIRDSLPLPYDLFLLIAGVLTVLGHNYSPFLGFKGGKGMATSAGFLLALVPWSLLICFSTWLLLFLTTRYVSIASIAAGLVLPIATFIFYPDQYWMIGATVFLGLMSVWRHRSNIQRLMNGTEAKFEKKSKSKEAVS